MVVGGHEWVKMFEYDMAAQWWEREMDVTPDMINDYRKQRNNLIKLGVIKPEDLPETPERMKQRGKYQVREIKLLSIIHPEEYKDDVLRYFAPYDRWIKNSLVKKIRLFFRPILKMTKMEYLSDKKLLKIRPHYPIKLIDKYVRVIPIAQKKDDYNRNGEML